MARKKSLETHASYLALRELMSLTKVSMFNSLSYLRMKQMNLVAHTDIASSLFYFQLIYPAYIDIVCKIYSENYDWLQVFTS